MAGATGDESTLTLRRADNKVDRGCGGEIVHNGTFRRANDRSRSHVFITLLVNGNLQFSLAAGPFRVPLPDA